MERKVLGKGLDILIPKRNMPAGAKEFTYLPLDKIQPSRYQPRQKIHQKDLDELSRSIKEKGIIQPVVVRKKGPGYELVAGTRRYQAAKSLGIKELPTIVKELDDKNVLVFAIVENLQRKDLNPIEEAEAFKKLMEEFSFSLDQISHVLGKDKTTVANALRLLKLPKQIRDAVREGVLTRTQARSILGLINPTDQQRLFNQIINQQLSVREIEKRVKKKTKKKKSIDPFILEAEEKMQKRLGTKVRIFNRRNNRGRVVIEYYTLDDLERVMSRIK